MPSVGEVYVSLGFDVDDKKLNSFSDDVKGAIGKVTALAAAAAGAVFAVNNFIGGAVNSAVALRNFGAETGLSLEQLQRWQQAATRTNLLETPEQVQASFAALSKAIAEAQLTGANSGVFTMLGITPDKLREGAFAVAEQLRQNFAQNVATWGQGKPQAVIDLMEKIMPGVAGLQQALMLSSEEFNRISGSILSPNQLANLNAVGAALANVAADFDNFRKQATAAFSPEILKGIQFLRDGANDLLSFGEAVGKIVAHLKELDPHLFTQLADAAGILLGILNPIKTVLFYIIYELAKLQQYKDAKGDHSNIGFMEFMKFAGSNLKDSLGDSLTDAAHWAKAINDENTVGGTSLGGARIEHLLPLGNPSQQSLMMNQTNNVTINSTASASDLANQLSGVQMSLWQKQTSFAASQLNNGAKY